MEYKLVIEKNEVDLCVVMRRDLPDTLLDGKRASLICSTQVLTFRLLCHREEGYRFSYVVMYMRHSKYCGRTHTDSDDFPWRWSRESRGSGNVRKKPYLSVFRYTSAGLRNFFFFIRGPHTSW